MRISPVLLGLAGAGALTLMGASIAKRPRVSLPALAIAAGRAPATACSLTSAQERTAVDAFDKLLPVVHHPAVPTAMEA